MNEKQQLPDSPALLNHLRGLVKRQQTDGSARAALAKLRRALGKPPGTDPEVYPYVTPYLPSGQYPGGDAAYFLIASLFAAWHQAGDACPTFHGTMGATFLNLCRNEKGKVDPDAKSSVERRFVSLLNAHPDDLPARLRHAVSLAKSAGKPIDWDRLLKDIQPNRWSHPDRYVQQQWARDFWPAMEDQNPFEEESNENGKGE